jgi:hypothetical protein
MRRLEKPGGGQHREETGGVYPGILGTQLQHPGPACHDEPVLTTNNRSPRLRLITCQTVNEIWLG